MAHPLLFDGTWLQQGKYESAEAFYQQVLAGTGGDAAGSSKGNNLLRFIPLSKVTSGGQILKSIRKVDHHHMTPCHHVVKKKSQDHFNLKSLLTIMEAVCFGLEMSNETQTGTPCRYNLVNESSMEFHQLCKHIPIFKTNIYDKNLELGANVFRTQTSNKTAASTLKTEIAQARQNIKQALDNETESSTSGDSQVLTRIKNLEAENKNLKQVAQDLQALVKKLDSRVCALEKGGSSDSKPAEAPKPAAEEEEDDDDFDPFGDDDESESDDEEKKKRLEAYHAKKSKKPTVVAKSSLGIDVKPWDDETDMKQLEQSVRSIVMDGLLWGQSKLVPVGYGIKKLHINAVVEDDKVSVDDLEEKITAFEDFVQSMDIAFFQKI